MTRLLFLGAFLLGIFCFSNAQSDLPKGFAEGEKNQMKSYLNDIRTTPLNEEYRTPPNGIIRTMAEWEELDGVAITWASFQSILAEIVRHVREETNVYIICSNANQVENYLVNNGIDVSTNVFYIEDQYDSIWIRDYGPNTVYINDVDSINFVNWIYNRPRYRDNNVPNIIGQYLDVPVISNYNAPNDLVNTGGNFMADGMGKGFSSELVLEENGFNNNFGDSNHDEDAVDGIMNAFMGIDHYIKMDVLPYDLIHHIDMHMKLLDERTLLVGQYPEGIADGPQIEANIQYVISNFEAAWNTTFDVVRMPMPPGPGNNFPNTGGDYRTYTNSLIANKTIIVPTYEEKYDTTALRIWKEQMPGYNIQGINCNDIIPLSGALHCITKEIGVQNPLLIAHAKLPNVEVLDNDDYEVEAMIKHTSGISSAFVYYKTSLNASYQEVEMVSIGDDHWQSIIPEQPFGTKVQYYISAESNSGKMQVRPMPAPDGYFEFEIFEPISNVNDPKEELKVGLGNVFPNPANAISLIETISNQSSDASLTIKNQLGQTIEVLFSGRLNAGSKNHFVNAVNFNPGIYFIHLETKDTLDVQKWVVH